MERIVQVAEEEGEQIIELPIEESDGSLLYSTLVKYFPKARGLRYYTEIDTIRGVKLANGKFYPPHINWGSTVYYCVFLEGNIPIVNVHFGILLVHCVIRAKSRSM